MTIQQLIDILSTLPPELEVYLDDTPLASVEVFYNSLENIDLVKIDDMKILVFSSRAKLPDINFN